MSLINDALKKAQRQRGDHPSPSAAPLPGGTAASSPRGAAPSGPQFWLLGAGALLGLGLALGAVFLLRDDPAVPAAATPAASTAAPSAPGTPATETITPPTVSAETGPAAAATTAAPPATPPGEPPLITVSTQPAPAVPVEEKTALPPTSPPRPSLRMINAIDAFRIAGVRASGTDSKVLMNDRVYRLGDTVDHELGIRITAVSANSVTFEDESRASYTRNF